MDALQKGTVMLIASAQKSVRNRGLDERVLQAVGELQVSVEIVQDLPHLYKQLSRAALEDEYLLIICPSVTKAGSASDVLYEVKAAGVNAVWIGYGAFATRTIAELLRLGADEILTADMSLEKLTASLRPALHLASSRCELSKATRKAHEELVAVKKSLRDKESEIASVRHLAIESLMLGLAIREADSIPHALRVRAYIRHLAKVAAYPERMCEALEIAALLHDIGKIGISEQTVLRQGWLSQPEIRELEPHAEFGARILERFDFLRSIAPIVHHHHERFDGHGSPDRLIGSSIPLGARIFAIADALDAMTSDKPYRAAMTFAVAAEEIQRNAGKQFDPKVVEQFLTVDVGVWETIRADVMQKMRSDPPLFFPATVAETTPE